jgi:hypothetical protein
MTEAEVMKTLISHVEGFFPKVCPTCQRRFMTLNEYVSTASPVGPYVSYDVESDRSTPMIGTLALANCPCGNTLSLSTDGLPLEMRTRLLEWVRAQATSRGMSHTAVLSDLRRKMRSVIFERDV